MYRERRERLIENPDIRYGSQETVGAQPGLREWLRLMRNVGRKRSQIRLKVKILWHMRLRS